MAWHLLYFMKGHSHKALIKMYFTLVRFTFRNLVFILLILHPSFYNLLSSSIILQSSILILQSWDFMLHSSSFHLQSSIFILNSNYVCRLSTLSWQTLLSSRPFWMLFQTWSRMMARQCMIWKCSSTEMYGQPFYSFLWKRIEIWRWLSWRSLLDTIARELLRI